MAKKIIIDPSESDLTPFDPLASAEKMPVDVSGGKIPLQNYMELPLDQIIEYQNKKDSDFRPYTEEKLNLLVESIKKDGVMEAITVRALVDGRFEVLAGEHRVKACRLAGLATVPAHVLSNLTDQQCETLFSATNLLRRDTTMRDRIAGWWHYYEANGDSLKSDSEGDVLDLVLESDTDINPNKYSKRHIYRFIKMHDLIDDLQDRLDAVGAKAITIMTGYWLSFLPSDLQEHVNSSKFKVTEAKAKQLKEMVEADANTTAEDLDKILAGDKKSKKKDDKDYLKPLEKQVKKIFETDIKPKYLPKSKEILANAISEYLANHPEYKK